ncbi:exonuclease domain-containing protein [Paracoccus onubensis]|uniref:exonuclease domain-containing protein n=1 Tax=Paracoccus onubensis TaxID=1675788 RepID=UPI00272FF893|nr:exonuclease domain-containing protein [Paracoccus onubensis]MDP0930055.1 exonuclease domain-containing protein [Paracoccus onubensis]
MTLFDWLPGRSSEPQRRDPQRADGYEPLSSRTDHPSARPFFGHAEQVPQGRFRFIALDVETACSDVASICQIGLACVQPDNEIQTFSMLIDPRTRFDPFNIRLHGIGPDHVAQAPGFADALRVLLPLLTQHHLVQHSNFDKQAVNAACRSCGIDAPDLRWSDSVTIARRAWPELKGNGGHGLANLKRKLNLRFHHHDAGEDARAAAMVVQHAESHLGLSFEDLIKPVGKKGYAPAITMAGNPSGPLAGFTVVFTGALGMSRTEAAELAARAGMSVKAGVTKQTTHLVVGDQDLSLLAGHARSSKHRKAQEMQDVGHPIQIIGESDFRRLVADCGTA